MNKTSKLSNPKKFRGERRFRTILLCGLFLSAFSALTPFSAAQTDRHILIEQTDIRARGPGYEVGKRNPRLQPILFKLPENTVVEIAGPAGFEANSDNPGLFGLRQGDAYRFKLTNIPFAEGRELYPTLELLSTLSPPAGYEADFPIPVELSQEDIDNALNGNLVTRVVFLEPPHNAIPVDSTVPQGDLLAESPASINPVALAESRGRVMAILRVGSRLPDKTAGLDSPFYFGLPPWEFPQKPKRPVGVPLNYPVQPKEETPSENNPESI